MGRLLSLFALCMAMALVLSAPVMAQAPSQGEPISLDSSTPPCPVGLAEVQAEYGPDVVCAEGGGYAYADTNASASASPDASADPCPDPNFPRETPDGCQASDLPDVTPGASATASASASASASAGTSALPETGGTVAPAMALPMLALLVVGGTFVARMVRR